MNAGLAELLVAASPVGMIALDTDGRVMTMNGAAEAILNRSAVAAQDCSLSDLIALPVALPVAQPYAAYDCALGRSHGDAQRVDLHLTPLGEGEPSTLVTLHPTSGAAALDARPDGSRSAVAAAAMLAHEIKNPLASIRGAAQLLEGDGCDDAGLTALIRSEVDRIVRLIDAMQDFTDGRPRRRERANVHLLIGHAVALAQAAHSGRFRLSEVFDPSLPDVIVVGDAIVQVLLNLLLNAIEAAPPDATAGIRVETRYRHGVTLTGREGVRQAVPIEIAVVDDGPGPPAELAPHLFEPFVTGKASGRGLGLALVDKLVRDNGGIVRFAREGEPPLTVFRVLLPRADA